MKKNKKLDTMKLFEPLRSFRFVLEIEQLPQFCVKSLEFKPNKKLILKHYIYEEMDYKTLMLSYGTDAIIKLLDKNGNKQFTCRLEKVRLDNFILSKLDYTSSNPIEFTCFLSYENISTIINPT